MQIIRTPLEFRHAYFYKTITPKRHEYPKEYPCILEIIQMDGGIGGGYAFHHVVYFPKDVDHQSFFEGYKAGREYDV